MAEVLALGEGDLHRPGIPGVREVCSQEAGFLHGTWIGILSLLLADDDVGAGVVADMTPEVSTAGDLKGEGAIVPGPAPDEDDLVDLVP